ncbi:MAG TPA: hypothetical protein VFV19_18385 [Candidatus Polarisedimenticolaceae bacterium]|nr:hypothetical protein [Candidatus Polarisedimenticolaceae bacterium]
MPRWLHLVLVPVTLLLATAQSKPAPRIEDTKLDEEERIQRRHDWFFSTRRAGVASAAEMAALRAAAVLDTHRALRAQATRRERGVEAAQNFWVAKGPSPSTFGGWTFGNVAGRIASLAKDPVTGRLWVGTASGGVWRSDNDGLSWTSAFDSAGTMTVGTVAIDPHDSNVVWVGTGENNQGCESYFGIGLLRSTDGGLTWEARNGSGASTLQDLSSFANVVVDPRDSAHLVTGGRIAGCTSGTEGNGAIYTSGDAGLTWTQRLANTSVYEIEQDPTVQSTFWAATSRGIYKSIDNAVTWVLQTASGLPNGSTGTTELAIAPSASGTVYALFGSPNALWRTTDGGATWAVRSTGSNACDGQCDYNMVLRVHRTNPNIVLRGTIKIWKSTDGALTWSDMSNGWGSSQKVHQDMHELLMDAADPNTFYAGGDGGLWKTSDLGATFTNKNGNMNITQFYAVGVDASNTDVICGGAQDNSSLVRTSSDVWDLQAVTGDGFVCHIDPFQSNVAYITSYPSGGYPSVSRSTTGVLGSYAGITGAGSGIIGGDRINWVTPYIVDPLQPQRLFLGTHRVYRSDDRGTTWTQVGPADLTGGSGTILTVEVNRIHDEVVYSGSDSGRVWRSADAGLTWTDLSSGLPGRSINDLGADPSDPGRVLATLGGFNGPHLYEWRSGIGWTSTGSGLPNVPANTVLLLTASDVLVGTDVGIFRSADGGATFVPYMNGLPEGLVVTDLEYNASQSVVTAATYGRGAWQVAVESFGPIVLYDSVALPYVQVDGDGDAYVEPGETWAVSPRLRNAGSAIASGVTARIVPTTPGIVLLDPSPRTFGDIAPGATAAASVAFTVDPATSCGSVAHFDVVDIATTNPQSDQGDKIDAFQVGVNSETPPPIHTVLLDERFDSPNPPNWSHRVLDDGIAGCNKTTKDQWHLATKDATRGTSYDCGNGPGTVYDTNNFAWLHYGGLDSSGGSGLVIPASAQVATLTIEHWYQTTIAGDGGSVLIDAVDDGQDVFSVLSPAGGYPSGVISPAVCNGLAGKRAFQGDSGGWVTSTFDLTPYRGSTVWIALVFGSDSSRQGDGEGWYVDRFKVEIETAAPLVCDVIPWPGSVPDGSLTIDKTAGSDLLASWGASCNAASVPGQTYAVHAGDLAALRATGAYVDAPIAGRCDRSSPATFTPGDGDEYYLVAPVLSGYEGRLGSDGAGTCGLPRLATCP